MRSAMCQPVVNDARPYASNMVDSWRAARALEGVRSFTTAGAEEEDGPFLSYQSRNSKILMSRRDHIGREAQATRTAWSSLV